MADNANLNQATTCVCNTYNRNSHNEQCICICTEHINGVCPVICPKASIETVIGFIDTWNRGEVTDTNAAIFEVQWSLSKENFNFDENGVLTGINVGNKLAGKSFVLTQLHALDHFFILIPSSISKEDATNRLLEVLRTFQVPENWIANAEQHIAIVKAIFRLHNRES